MSPEPFTRAQAAHVGHLLALGASRARAAEQNRLLLILLACFAGAVGAAVVVARQASDAKARAAAQQLPAAQAQPSVRLALL